MVPFVLPSILQIIDMVGKDDVATYIMPRFKVVLAISEPIQVGYDTTLILQHCLNGLKESGKFSGIPILCPREQVVEFGLMLFLLVSSPISN